MFFFVFFHYTICNIHRFSCVYIYIVIPLIIEMHNPKTNWSECICEKTELLNLLAISDTTYVYFLWVVSYYVYDVGNSRKTMESMDQNYCDDCDVGDTGCSWFSKKSWTSIWLRGQRRLGGRCCGHLEQVPWIKILVDRIGRVHVPLYFSRKTWRRAFPRSRVSI